MSDFEGYRIPIGTLRDHPAWDASVSEKDYQDFFEAAYKYAQGSRERFLQYVARNASATLKGMIEVLHPNFLKSLESADNKRGEKNHDSKYR